MRPLPAILILSLLLMACGGGESHVAAAIGEEDVPTMTAHGVSTLISDSGMVRYKIIAEEWLVYEARPERPSHWDFKKGFYMHKFDEQWRVEFYVQSDTAYCHHDDLWELRGNVVARNMRGSVFTTEELFWDMTRHEIYSSLYVHIQEPERELGGYNFRSNEQLTRYTIYNSAGRLPVEKAQADTTQNHDKQDTNTKLKSPSPF